MDFPQKSSLIEFDYSLRSRYSETDKMGNVYHARFLEYFEVARVEMIRSYGLSYQKMEEEGVMLPVINAELEFRQPVVYDEEIIIRVFIFDTPGVRLQTYYQVIAAEREQVCVLGKVTLCFMDKETRRPCRAPGYFLDQFNKEARSV